MKPKKKSTLSTFLNNDNTVGYVFALPVHHRFLLLNPGAHGSFPVLLFLRLQDRWKSSAGGT